MTGSPCRNRLQRVPPMPSWRPPGRGLEEISDQASSQCEEAVWLSEGDPGAVKVGEACG